MQFVFDLISDLHIETWDGQFDWQGQATSPICVVAGDVCRDHDTLKQTLTHLGKCYHSVLYIDGNDEHKNHWYSLSDNYQSLDSTVNGCPNVVFLQDNLVIINGVAILGTNGWWTWDFDQLGDPEQSQQWFQDRTHCSNITPFIIEQFAENDANYLESSIRRLQTHPDVKRIVVVTHTVPGRHFVQHDLSLIDSHRINVMGNSHMPRILEADSQQKISHWCFGHYHSKVDQVVNGVRYVNNCRGRGDTDYHQSVYYPLRIEINY